MIELLPIGPEAAAELADAHAEAFDYPWDAESLAETLASPGALALAARGDGRLLGFVLLRVVLEEAEVLILSVGALARRRGLGRALLEAGAGLAGAAGARALWLEVAADNDAALALYAAADFARSGARPGYYPRRAGPPVDALVLRRDLASARP